MSIDGFAFRQSIEGQHLNPNEPASGSVWTLAELVPRGETSMTRTFATKAGGGSIEGESKWKLKARPDDPADLQIEALRDEVDVLQRAKGMAPSESKRGFAALVERGKQVVAKSDQEFVQAWPKLMTAYKPIALNIDDLRDDVMAVAKKALDKVPSSDPRKKEMADLLTREKLLGNIGDGYSESLRFAIKQFPELRQMDTEIARLYDNEFSLRSMYGSLNQRVRNSVEPTYRSRFLLGTILKGAGQDKDGGEEDHLAHMIDTSFTSERLALLMKMKSPQLIDLARDNKIIQPWKM